jgi:hypothetical protein
MCAGHDLIDTQVGLMRLVLITVEPQPPKSLRKKSSIDDIEFIE